MSSEESRLPATKHRSKIRWLLLTHVAIGIGSVASVAYTGRSAPELLGAFLAGLTLGQASLLGIWFSLGSSRWYWRLLGVTAVVAFIGMLWERGRGDLTSSLVDATVVCSFTAVPFLIVRLFRFTMRQDYASVGDVYRIQFSILHLLTFTTIMACLLTVERFVEPFAIQLIETDDGNLVINQLDEVAFQWFGYVVVGLLGPLSASLVLATRQPLSMGVVLLFVGTWAGFITGKFYDQSAWLSATVAVTEVLTIVASLLVVRTCGYRLVRLGRQSKVTSDPGAHEQAL